MKRPAVIALAAFAIAAGSGVAAYYITDALLRRFLP